MSIDPIVKDVLVKKNYNKGIIKLLDMVGMGDMEVMDINNNNNQFKVHKINLLREYKESPLQVIDMEEINHLFSLNIVILLSFLVEENLSFNDKFSNKFFIYQYYIYIKLLIYKKYMHLLLIFFYLLKI